MKIPSTSDLVIWGGVAIAGLWLCFVVKGWHDDSVYKLPQARAALKASEDSRKQEQEQNALTEVHTYVYVKKAEEINDPSRKLTGVVCKRTSSVPTVSPTAGASGSTGAGGESGVSGGDSLRDVSEGTTVYGKRCELLGVEVGIWRDWWRDQNELSRKFAKDR